MWNVAPPPLTTVGYGDITPVAHAARSLAILEALIDQLYPVIVLARLVSLQVAGGEPPNASAVDFDQARRARIL
jgi:hypothetical protein